MTFVVPFDGSDLSEAALRRAGEYGKTFEENVIAVCVVSERRRYAREKGWIDDDEEFDLEAVVDELGERVREIVPDVEFDYEQIREYPPVEKIAEHVQTLIERHDPTVVFLGSDNVGGIVTPVSSVGAHVTADEAYDVYIVCHPDAPTPDHLE
ncbi:universal stress protein [Natrialbaceae archaeon A-gly3]